MFIPYPAKMVFILVVPIISKKELGATPKVMFRQQRKEGQLS